MYLCRIPAVHPVTVVGNPDDVGVLAVIRDTEHYEPNVFIAVLHTALPPDAVVIDGGGNIGVIAMGLAQYVPSGRVYVFEPGRENLGYLRRNLSDNAFDHVTVVPVGLWDSSQRLLLHRDETHPAGSFVGDAGDGYTHAESIDVVALDDWVAENGLDRVDLVKLDIEGAEPEALEGARRTIERFRPRLVVEYNLLALRRLHPGDDPWRLYRQLKRSYPNISYIGDDGTVRRILSIGHLRRAIVRRGYADLLCLPWRRKGRPWIRQMGAAVLDLVGLVLSYNRFRPPARAFLVNPRYRATFSVDGLEVSPGARSSVPVRLENTGDVWLSSEYQPHPMHLGYHWVDATGAVAERDGLRTPFPRPIGPGRSVEMELTFVAPSSPGRYTLRLSVVQERFAWCDEMIPSLAVDLPVVVT